MNCSAPITPGPRRDRNWWDESPAKPPEGRTVLPWVVAAFVVVVAALVLGGGR